MAHYAPASLNESIYDVAFYGDSLLVAAKTKVNLLKDNGSSFSYLGTVATYTGSTNRVRGVDVKDSLLAFTVCYSAGNAQDGVYIYNLKNLQQLSFYNDTQGDPQDVYFGQNTKLLHVMGGSLSSNVFDGQYYAMDYTNPANPTVIFTQTIHGLALLSSISMPMNCCLINDTLYVSTQGGGPIGYTSGTYSGQIYVFKATSTSNVSLLTDIYAGLYHFDCDIDPVTRTMYIASEWYGVLTVDVHDIYNEMYLQKNITGGWCHGSSRAKTRLAEASEGFGIRLFDVSNMQNPLLTAIDTTRGFCRAISLSDSADYVYAWFLTGKTLRVRDANNNLAFVKDTTGDPSVSLPSDFKKSRCHNGRLAVIEEYGLFSASHRIVLADVSIPSQAHVITARQKDNIEDILFHPSGVLMALAQDSLLVLDQNNLSLITSIKPPLGNFQPYKAFALYNDTLYVFYENVGEGIAKYYYDPNQQTLTYLSAGIFNMSGSDRIFMAADNSVLYIASSLDSLRAISKSAPHTVIAKYNHGADFVIDKFWGNTDLYYNKGYLFLNEYQGQTSIFGPANTTGIATFSATKEQLHVYPNPATAHFTIEIGTREGSLVQIYDVQGKRMYIADVAAQKFTLSTEAFHRGLYFVSVTTKGQETITKLLVEK